MVHTLDSLHCLLIVRHAPSLARHACDVIAFQFFVMVPAHCEPIGCVHASLWCNTDADDVVHVLCWLSTNNAMQLHASLTQWMVGPVTLACNAVIVAIARVRSRSTLCA